MTIIRGLSKFARHFEMERVHQAAGPAVQWTDVRRLPHCRIESVLMCLALLPVFCQVTRAGEGFTLPAIEGGALVDWHPLGCQATVEREQLLLRGNGELQFEHPLENFRLQLQWQALPGCKTSLSFRRAMGPHDSEGMEGHRVSLGVPDAGALDRPALPGKPQLVKEDQWNALQLTVVKGNASLSLNGELLWETDKVDAAPGVLALLVEAPPDTACRFRRLSVTELDHRSMFNGVDLTGWEGGGAEASLCWKVEDGLLICTGEKGPWLRSVQQHGDFNFRLWYKLQPGGNSGIYVRVPEDGDHHGEGAGVEVQILDDGAERYRKLEPYQFSGSIYKIAPAEHHVARPAGEWNSLEINCQGTSYRIIHNGVVIVEANEATHPELSRRALAGFLGLQNHSEEVFFRHLRIGPPLEDGSP